MFPYSSLETFLYQHTQQVNPSLALIVRTITEGRNVRTYIYICLGTCIIRSTNNNNALINVGMKHPCIKRAGKLMLAV